MTQDKNKKPRTVKSLIKESHKTAVEKGWWENPDRNLYEQLFLMHTELSEAGEELRSGHGVEYVYENADRPVSNYNGDTLLKPEGFLAEIADLFIRAGDTLGRYGLTSKFLDVLEAKLEYNKHREYRHGGKQA